MYLNVHNYLDRLTENHSPFSRLLCHCKEETVSDHALLQEENLQSFELLDSLKTLFFSRIYCSLCKEKEYVRSFQEALAREDSSLKKELQPIVEKHIEILDRKSSQELTVIALTSTFIASSILSLLGAVLNIPGLISLGIASAIVLGSAAIFKLFWHMDCETVLKLNEVKKIHEINETIKKTSLQEKAALD